MNHFERLLQKSRPFVAFSYDAGDNEQITLYTRRMGQIDNESASLVWEEAYRKAKTEFQDSDKEQTAIYEALDRAQNDRLATLIAKSERPDFLSESAAILEKLTTDEEVIKEADERVRAREDELKTCDHEYLVELAFKRRYHSYAVDTASIAQMRYMTKSILFEEKEPGKFIPLFETIEQVAALPQSEIVALMDAASAALNPKETTENQPDPLP